MTPMVVQCSSCLTEFELDPRKVPTSGVRARCSVCSAVIAVPAPPHERRDDRAAQPETRTAPAAQSPEPERAPARPVSELQPTGAAAGAGTSGQAPAAPLGAMATATAAAPSATTATETSRAASDVTPAGGVSRRPINPFLSRDPALRAKRLARALVSDIVAYHPARHAEGLREGTLKTLFRDEIKKSYEEYVDQVGRDFASSTTHFQDALNDVLAGGKKLF